MLLLVYNIYELYHPAAARELTEFARHIRRYLGNPLPSRCGNQILGDRLMDVFVTVIGSNYYYHVYRYLKIKIIVSTSYKKCNDFTDMIFVFCNSDLVELHSIMSAAEKKLAKIKIVVKHFFANL